ncbi:MAG: 3-dehydroquinate synthase [Anaerolineaceae bacterium]|nr:3-dehydroquinate synthase [Anaerolineaceae bacterium]
MADSIRVTAPGGAYDIHISKGILENINPYLPAGKSVVITNTTLAPLYGKGLVNRLPDAALAEMTDGEQYKTLDTVSKLYDALVDAGLDRSGTVIALGGGVVGDTAGFVAATYMRGVRLIQIPTSLLSMVDSSVGGKVGVDLPQGKNLVGAFKQPDCVLIDPEVLATLPEREWRCGMGEIIKHGLLADEGLLAPELWAKDRAAELVRRAVQVKVDVVQQDPYEKGVRAHLNLGHTFAHAIERVSNYSWLHGEAVGVGLVAAARLSYALGLCNSELAEEVEDIVDKVGLPTRLGSLDAENLFSAMGTDKKWQAGHSRFILLRGICQPVIVEDVPKAAVIQVLQELAG